MLRVRVWAGGGGGGGGGNPAANTCALHVPLGSPVVRKKSFFDAKYE